MTEEETDNEKDDKSKKEKDEQLEKDEYNVVSDSISPD
jgi:hypothetical protein